jgi:hypothetical protein
MDTTDQDHLSRDLVIQALIDEMRLPPAAQAHLAACAICRAEKDKLEMRLRRLGQMAEQVTPAAKRTGSGAADASGRRGFLRGWGLRPLLALPVLVLMILLVAKWHPPAFRRQAPSSANIVSDQMADPDRRLMDDIAKLVDDPLPSLYQDISGLSGAQSGDESLDDMVPGFEEDRNVSDEPRR